MRFYLVISIMLLFNMTANAQSWVVYERTNNDLIHIESKALSKDTLKLISGKSYEINLPDLFDQNTGSIQKKLYVQNLSMADYIDLEIQHEQNIIDLMDTVYTAKVKFKQVNTEANVDTAYPAKIVIRDPEGGVEKELTLLPDYSSSRR